MFPFKKCRKPPSTLLKSCIYCCSFTLQQACALADSADGDNANMPIINMVTVLVNVCKLKKGSDSIREVDERSDEAKGISSQKALISSDLQINMCYDEIIQR